MYVMCKNFPSPEIMAIKAHTMASHMMAFEGKKTLNISRLYLKLSSEMLTLPMLPCGGI